MAALFGAGHPVIAVGDPDQNIYAWRGASLYNLFRRLRIEGPRQARPVAAGRQQRRHQHLLRHGARGAQVRERPPQRLARDEPGRGAGAEVHALAHRVHGQHGAVRQHGRVVARADRHRAGHPGRDPADELALAEAHQARPAATGGPKRGWPARRA